MEEIVATAVDNGGLYRPGDENSDNSSDEHIKIAVSTAAQMAEVLGRTPRGGGRAAPRGPKKSKKVWKNDGEYDLVRDGQMLMEDPDEVLSSLQERTLCIFRHRDPAVKLGEDPNRPLWVGVFRMSPELGYGEDEFYHPKQTHFKAIYQVRDRKKMPKVNGVETNLISPPNEHPDMPVLPYWVDAHYRFKENESRTRHKPASSGVTTAAVGKTTAAATTTAAAPKVPKKPGSAASKRARAEDTVVPVDNVYLFPLSAKDEEQSEGGKRGTVVHSMAFLRSNPAAGVEEDMANIIAALGGGTGAAAVAAVAATSAKAAAPKKRRVTFAVPAPLPQDPPGFPPVVWGAPSAAAAPSPTPAHASAPVTTPPASNSSGRPDFLALKRMRAEYNMAQIGKWDRGEIGGPYHALMTTQIDPDDLLADFCKWVCGGGDKK